jgi:hypothetical protein
MPAPYAGDQANYPKSVDILSGSDAPNSTNFNTGWEGALDRTAFINGCLVANGGINWPPLANVNPWMFSVGTIIWSACWDPFNEQWLVGNSYDNFGSGNVLVNASFNGHDWSQVSPSLGHLTWFAPIAMACDPLGTLAMIRTDFATNHSITVQTQPFASVEVSPTLGTGTFAPGQGVMTFFYDGTGISQWLFVGASGATSTTGWTGMSVSGEVTGAGPPPATTWTNLQSALPAHWAGTSSNSVLQWLACSDESFPAAGDATQVVFAQCGSRPGTDKSYLLQWVSSSSLTFADITPSFLNSGAFQCRGIAWSPVDQLWGMICVDGDMNGHGTSPANSYFLTSPDLVTWTTTFSFFNFLAAGLACNGNVWSILACETLYTNQTSNRVLFSANVSLGVLQTWEAADYTDSLSLITTIAIGGYAGRLYLGNSAQFFTAYPFGVTVAPPFRADAGASHLAINGLG